VNTYTKVHSNIANTGNVFTNEREFNLLLINNVYSLFSARDCPRTYM